MTNGYHSDVAKTAEGAVKVEDLEEKRQGKQQECQSQPADHTSAAAVEDQPGHDA